MTATPVRKLFPVSEEELADLMRNCEVVQCTFGPGGVALEWLHGHPMPAAVKRLGLMRGVLNRNTDGDGI